MSGRCQGKCVVVVHVAEHHALSQESGKPALELVMESPQNICAELVDHDHHRDRWRVGLRMHRGVREQKNSENDRTNLLQWRLPGTGLERRRKIRWRP